MLEVRIEHAGPQLTALAKRCRKMANGPAMRRRMLTGLKKGVQPAVERSKRAALDLPSKGKGKNKLRRKMSRAVAPQVRTGGKNVGVRVRISKTRMGNLASVATATNRGRWRHPVYGQRNVWVTQRSRKGWFDDANSSNRNSVRRALVKVLDDIEKEMNKGL